MSRDVWLDVAFDYPSTMVWIRLAKNKEDAASGEEILNLSAEQEYTWEREAGDPKLDGMNIVGIRLHEASWPKRVAPKKHK